MNGKNQSVADEDSRLVVLCKKSDLKAFESLVRKHEKNMLNIAYRMIGNYEEACEVVQDAFISAYKSIKNFEEKSKFSTWLCAIVINLSKNRIKQLRSQLYHERFSIDDPVPTGESYIKVELASNEPSVIERLEIRETQQRVQACINSLEDELREAIILRDIQGFSYDEISDILKIPEGTVKSRLSRARDALKNCLKKVIGDI
jgi:RNA polymerase sigma-70 factor (ECF subfamily)